MKHHKALLTFVELCRLSGLELDLLSLKQINKKKHIYITTSSLIFFFFSTTT